MMTIILQAPGLPGGPGRVDGDLLPEALSRGELVALHHRHAHQARQEDRVRHQRRHHRLDLTCPKKSDRKTTEFIFQTAPTP